MSNEIIEVQDLVRHEDRDTYMSYCVSKEEDTFEKEAERIFLPKSQVEYVGEYKAGHSFNMPEWLALEKGLI